MWILRQTRRFVPPCLRVFHSPSPWPSPLMPALSSKRCSGPSEPRQRAEVGHSPGRSGAAGSPLTRLFAEAPCRTAPSSSDRSELQRHCSRATARACRLAVGGIGLVMQPSYHIGFKRRIPHAICATEPRNAIVRTLSVSFLLPVCPFLASSVPGAQSRSV